MLALYQAQNAIQTAAGVNAERYAPERLQRARQLYDQARAYPANLSREIIALAREATQVAEDARLIAVKRGNADRAAEEQQHSLDTRRRAELERTEREAEAESQRARSEPARVSVPAPAPAPETPPQPIAPAPAPVARPPIEVDSRQFARSDPRAGENRRIIMSTLRGAFPVTDSPRGIMITLPEVVAGSAALSTHLASVASAIRPYRNLHVEVEAHSDRSDDIGGTQRRADAVRAALMAAGISPDIIVARGLGNARPLTSNATASGRARNRRIEIIIAGDAIGSVPTWDRTYTLRPPQPRR
jgi:flagellar motor protein MotB